MTISNSSDQQVPLLKSSPSGRSKLTLGLVLLLVATGLTALVCYLNSSSPYAILKSWDSDSTADQPVNFIAIGDWGRHGRYNQSRVAHQMGKVASSLNVGFVISTGDNFYNYGLTGVEDSAFQHSFSDVYSSRSLRNLPWFAVLGNHDYRGDVLAQLDTRLTERDPRWKCIRHGRLSYKLTPVSSGVPYQLELFLIDTTPFVDYYWAQTEHRMDWRGLFPRQKYLEDRLKSLAKALNESTATWKIVVGHHTMRSYGVHGDTVELIQRVLPILEENNVDIYLNGHDHCLQHIKRDDSSVHFVTSGGGSKAWNGALPPQNSNGLRYYNDGQGFVSVSAAPGWLQVVYYNILGQVVHTLRLSKPDSYSQTM